MRVQALVTKIYSPENTVGPVVGPMAKIRIRAKVLSNLLKSFHRWIHFLLPSKLFRNRQKTRFQLQLVGLARIEKLFSIQVLRDTMDRAPRLISDRHFSSRHFFRPEVGIGCSTAIEYTHWDRCVMGFESHCVLGFFLLYPISNVSLIGALTEVQYYWFSFKKFVLPHAAWGEAH